MMTLVLTTCKPSPINGGEGTSEGQDDGYIMLVFNEKKSANRDTSPDTDTESALSHLDVMMYKYNEDNYTYEPFYHERVDVTQYPDGTAYLKRKKDDFEPFAKYKIYVVANSTHSESVFKPEGTAVISHENLMRLDQTDENIHLSGIKGGKDVYPQYFLMDGVAYMGDSEPNNPGTIVVNDDELDNIVLKVKLRRATAKYVIKIYPGENVEFTQQMLAEHSKGYMMRNMPIRTRVVAEGKYPNNNPAYWKSSTISQSPYFEYVQEDNNKYHLRVTLYCYSHRWNSAEFFDKGTSFVFMLPIVYSDDKGVKTEYINNYYQLVLNKKETGQEYEHIIKRNTFYELRVKLNAPGAEDFTVPEELEDIYYFTAPWTEKELNIDGESTVAYLKVNKDKLYMYNIAEDNTSLYFSSSSPVKTEIVSNSVYYYNKYGNKTTLKTYNISASTNANATSGNIKVNSAIPTNNTILYFTIKLTNQEGLSELIEVEQYPLIYVTNLLPWYSYREDFYYRKTDGHDFDENCSTDRDKKNLPTTYSYGGDRIASVHVSSVSSNGTIKYKYNRKEGSSNGFFSSKHRGDAAGENKYQNLFYYYNSNNSGNRQNGTCENSANLRNYHIRVMASSNKYTLGRPRIENGYTASDEENAKLVSPSFVIASRLGAVYSTYGGLSDLDLDEKLIVFADHAKNYVEVDDIDDKKDANNVVVYDNWRLPTKAEIEIIIELQGTADQNADAVDYLLNGAYYMSASGPVFNPKNSDGVKETDQSKKNDVAIRCVRDVYYE